MDKSQIAEEEPSKAPIGLLNKRMNINQLTIMVRLFETVYLLGKEKLAFREFEGICKLQKAKIIELGNKIFSKIVARNYSDMIVIPDKYHQHHVRASIRNSKTNKDQVTLEARLEDTCNVFGHYIQFTLHMYMLHDSTDA